MTPDDRSPDPPPPSVALALGLLAVVVVIAACAGIDRARRVWRRVRIALGERLIDVGVRATPDLPADVEPDYERMRARIMAAVAAEGRGPRANGRCKGYPPKGEGPI